MFFFAFYLLFFQLCMRWLVAVIWQIECFHQKVNGFLFHFFRISSENISLSLKANWKLTSTTLLIQTLETSLWKWVFYCMVHDECNTMQRPNDFCYSLIIIMVEVCILMFVLLYAGWWESQWKMQSIALISIRSFSFMKSPSTIDTNYHISWWRGPIWTLLCAIVREKDSAFALLRINLMALHIL